MGDEFFPDNTFLKIFNFFILPRPWETKFNGTKFKVRN